MLEGTERETLRLVLDEERTPTEIAEELEVSVQTASRNLKKLKEKGYVTEVSLEKLQGERRGYKAFRAAEFARIFATYDGVFLDKRVDLSPDKRGVLSIWSIPQPQFHPVLLSYVFTPLDEHRYNHVVSLAVYGSVARGEAKPDSDIDILVICDETVDTDDIYTTTINWAGGHGPFKEKRVISETWMTKAEFEKGVTSGSSFLQNALDEAIVIYDHEDVIHNAR